MRVNYAKSADMSLVPTKTSVEIAVQKPKTHEKGQNSIPKKKILIDDGKKWLFIVYRPPQFSFPLQAFLGQNQSICALKVHRQKSRSFSAPRFCNGENHE